MSAESSTSCSTLLSSEQIWLVTYLTQEISSPMSTNAFPLGGNIEAVDQTPIASTASEEVAGPPIVTTAPVTQAERVNSVDVLRGISLMGILVMNITDFAFGYHNYMFPLSTVKPVFNGPHWKANTILWFLRWILAEGKMRGLFSILFGAGVILLTGRAESRGAGVRTADIYTRRNMWLLLFGMLHCFFIWNGDILYLYASCALIFLFPFRNLKIKTLLWSAAIVLFLNAMLVDVGRSMGTVSLYKNAAKAEAALAQHKPLTDDQKKAIENRNKEANDFRYPAKKELKDIADHRGYGNNFGASAQNAFKGEAFGGFPLIAGDWLGMMLLGMALYKNGFLSLKRSTKLYAITALICLGISWPVTYIGCHIAWKSGFDEVKTLYAVSMPYDIGRVAGAIGNAALILLLLRLGVFKWFLAKCGNVGQMALSNYLLTSITMQVLYVWSPLHWYGYMDYYKVYIVMGCMWLFNLVFSTIWLKFFRFGPFEWAWRSLTYWKRQPFLRSTETTPPPAPIPATALA